MDKRNQATDYEVVKLALDSIDLVILRSLLQQAVECRPDAERQRLDLLTRARDLLVEFCQGHGHDCELAGHKRRPALTL
jgi:hypothetical protein